jgi:hypothetical protein
MAVKAPDNGRQDGEEVHRGGQAAALGGGFVGPTNLGFFGISSGKLVSKPSAGRMRAASDCSRKNEQRRFGDSKFHLDRERVDEMKG